MRIKKKTITKKRSPARRAVKRRPSKITRRLFGSKGFLSFPRVGARFRPLGFMLLFAAIGGTLVFSSFAATPWVGTSSVDEKDQVSRINNARAHYTDMGRFPNGEPSLKVAGCIRIANEKHAKDTSNANTLSDIPLSTMLYSCGIDPNVGPYSAGANAAVIGDSCTAPGDGCSLGDFNGLMGSPEHRANILQPCARTISSPHICPADGSPTMQNNDTLGPGGPPVLYRYVGVGTYRDSRGKLWVSQGFIGNCGCSLAWTLTGGTTASSAGVARAANISVSRGAVISWYHDIKNNGPDTATYPRHVNIYHYSKSGALLYSTQLNVGTSTTGAGNVYLWTYNSTVATNATVGDKYCHVTYYGNASGAYTPADTTNRACVTVK